MDAILAYIFISDMITCLFVSSAKVFRDESLFVVVSTCLLGFIFLPISVIIYVIQRLSKE